MLNLLYYWHLVLGGLVIKSDLSKKTFLSTYILTLVKPLPFTEMAELPELPNWKKTNVSICQIGIVFMFADLIRPFALIAKTRFHSLKDAWTILEVMSLMSTIWNMSLFTNFSISLNFRWFRCKSCSSGRKPSLSSEEDIYVPKDSFKKRCLRSVFIFVYFLLAVVAVVVTYAMVQVCTCFIISI